MRFLSENLIKAELTDVFLIKSCLYALCSEYLKQIPLEDVGGSKASIMGAVVEYVEKNYKNPISLATLAESLGYEYCYFSKIFNRLFSMRFNDYLNIYRFNEACAMLTDGNLSITEISYESGFQSVRSFNNTFKRLSGVSPGKWRSSSSSR
jgi:AraC-like DNA-binding protein